LNENLDAKAVRTLIGAGLNSRFSRLCTQWQKDSNSISKDSDIAKRLKESSVTEGLGKQSPSLTRMFHMALVDAIIEKFP